MRTIAALLLFASFASANDTTEATIVTKDGRLVLISSLNLEGKTQPKAPAVASPARPFTMPGTIAQPVVTNPRQVQVLGSSVGTQQTGIYTNVQPVIISGGTNCLTGT